MGKEGCQSARWDGTGDVHLLVQDGMGGGVFLLNGWHIKFVARFWQASKPV